MILQASVLLSPKWLGAWKGKSSSLNLLAPAAFQWWFQKDRANLRAKARQEGDQMLIPFGILPLPPPGRTSG